MSNKREMLKHFRASSDEVLFVHTKLYFYRIIKKGRFYRIWELNIEGSLNPANSIPVTVTYNSLARLIRNNVKFYEMDSYTID